MRNVSKPCWSLLRLFVYDIVVLAVELEVFDVRIVDGTHPRARMRLIVAALTGNLSRSTVYTRRLAQSLALSMDSHDHTLAADGEVFEGDESFTVEKCPKPLLVYAPK